ncbi:hypothetical protein OB03_07115 [Brevundimonas sp. GN22]|uniref:hypothetical protein n=1 Tax=Brevundimonas pishanensis TaxID=2896315 RepID=UPI001FA6E21E|nr:hypothetical protein [Brevundimonas pishanensis]
MGETFRAILLVALIAAFATTTFFFLSWWMESERRLRRAMKNALSGTPDMQAIAPAEGKAAGLDLDNEQLAVLWNKGSIGLVFEYPEIEGAEVIVDRHVVARVRRHLGRNDLDVLVEDAESVILRLMFRDPHCPEFEISLWRAHWSAPEGGPAANNTSSGPQLTGSANEGLRLARRWLAHIEAVVKG